MKRTAFLVTLVLCGSVLAVSCKKSDPSPTAPVTITQPVTIRVTDTSTITSTPSSHTPTETGTPTHYFTITPTFTETFTPVTIFVTHTPTVTNTPYSHTPTDTPSVTPTPTPTATPTDTPTESPTITSTYTFTITETFTSTWTPVTIYVTPTRTHTPIPIPGMVYVPAGNFWMGHTDGMGYVYERPRHEVYLDSFYVDINEVTFDKYDTFCSATARATPSDSGWGRGTRPVINISWNDAKAYCEWEGKRLLTEAEWEKACRGGTDTQWSFGDTVALLDYYAWYAVNSGSMTHPVVGKLPNYLGLYDMHGNVWEWVEDWCDQGYYAVSPSINPMGPTSGSYRVKRGGSWNINPNDMRSATRDWQTQVYVSSDIGCRCAKTP